MDYRTGVRLARALADGEEAFVAAAASSEDFDPEAFARFAHAHNLREWLTPLAAHPGARALIGESFAGILEGRTAALPAERQALLALMRDIDDAYRAAAIPCVHFKGLVLAERFYGDLQRRHQYDVDVLVHPADFEKALAALEPLGFDPRITASGKPAERRLEKMRTRGAGSAPQTVTLRREDGLKVDLHCRLKGRLFRGLDEDAVWRDLQTLRIAGQPFATLSDERILAHIPASIAADLRRSGCRGKQFLDLYLALRRLEPEMDWEGFFARRAEEGTERVAVNVLAILFTLWGVAAEFPALGAALERRARQVALLGPGEALAVVTRPRHSRRNHLWFLRLRTGASPWLSRVVRGTVDLPRGVRRPGTPPWRARTPEPAGHALPRRSDTR